jgi:hypothetical protein
MPESLVSHRVLLCAALPRRNSDRIGLPELLGADNPDALLACWFHGAGLVYNILLYDEGRIIRKISSHNSYDFEVYSSSYLQDATRAFLPLLERARLANWALSQVPMVLATQDEVDALETPEVVKYVESRRML